MMYFYTNTLVNLIMTAPAMVLSFLCVVMLLICLNVSVITIYACCDEWRGCSALSPACWVLCNASVMFQICLIFMKIQADNSSKLCKRKKLLFL